MIFLWLGSFSSCSQRKQTQFPVTCLDKARIQFAARCRLLIAVFEADASPSSDIQRTGVQRTNRRRRRTKRRGRKRGWSENGCASSQTMVEAAVAGGVQCLRGGRDRSHDEWITNIDTDAEEPTTPLDRIYT